MTFKVRSKKVGADGNARIKSYRTSHSDHVIGEMFESRIVTPCGIIASKFAKCSGCGWYHPYGCGHLKCAIEAAEIHHHWDLCKELIEFQDQGTINGEEYEIIEHSHDYSWYEAISKYEWT